MTARKKSLDKIKSIKRSEKVESEGLESEWWKEGELRDARKNRGHVANAR